MMGSGVEGPSDTAVRRSSSKGSSKTSRRTRSSSKERGRRKDEGYQLAEVREAEKSAEGTRSAPPGTFSYVMQSLLEGLEACQFKPRSQDDAEVAVPSLDRVSLKYGWPEINMAIGRQPTFLGRGKEGSVFRGVLPEGTEVAIKVVEAVIDGSIEDEIRMLARCHHPNIVTLLGFATEPPPMKRLALVYELLVAGSAFHRLYALPEVMYSWRARVQTITDLVKGLAHLHKLRPEVFHRDIKTENVLFSGNGPDGAAKLGDFGIACASTSSHKRYSEVDLPAGTPGYVDPVYLRTKVVKEASEVYSTGMVMLELLTAKQPASPSTQDPRKLRWLVEELKLRDPAALDRVVAARDSRPACIGNGWFVPTAVGLGMLALRCIQDDDSRRPKFVKIGQTLNDIAAEVPEHLRNGDSKQREDSMGPRPSDGSARGGTSSVNNLKVGSTGSGASRQPRPEYQGLQRPAR